MPDKKTRKLLMTIRAALIMAVKAIELYLSGNESDVVKIEASDNVSLP